MRHRISKQLTVLITCTGRNSLTLSFPPRVVISAVILSIAIPSGLVVGVVSSYIHKNNQLTQQNNGLAQEATHILERVEVLEAEIEALQQRAGIPNEKPTAKDPQSRFQGGEAIPLPTNDVLAIAKAKIPLLLASLRGEVQPALEQVLDREEARPKGIPLQSPTTEISSSFGLRRNPFGWNYEFHPGLDFTGPYGSPVEVTAPGIVITAEFDRGFGYHVVVDHGYGYQTLYAHLSKMAVTSGMYVDRHQVVGYLGNTGRSSGPHLHYGIYKNGKAIDPQDYLD